MSTVPSGRSSSAAVVLAGLALVISLGCAIAIVPLWGGKKALVGHRLDVTRSTDDPCISASVNQAGEAVLVIHGESGNELSLIVPKPTQKRTYRLETLPDGSLSLRESGSAPR